MYFLKSFAYAGIAVVAFAVVAGGDRAARRPAGLIGRRRLGRRLLRRPEPVRRPVEQIFFYRSTKFVMRPAIPIGLAIVALHCMPFFSVKWGVADDRVLPTSGSARQVGNQLRTDFADDLATNVTVVIPDAAGCHGRRAGSLRSAALAGARCVVGVRAGWHVRRRLAGRTALGGNRDARDGSAFLTVGSTAPLFSPASDTQLDRLHAVAGPGSHRPLREP